MFKPTLIMRCGCEVPFVDGKVPRCEPHQESRVAGTRHMPKPTIRGTAKGPLVQTEDLSPSLAKLKG